MRLRRGLPKKRRHDRIEFRLMQIVPPAPEDRETFLGLEYAASAAYNDFAYADRAQADAVRAALLGAGVAEFAPPHGLVLVADGKVEGMVACLSAGDLRKCRMRCAFFLGKSPEHGQDEALIDRMALAGRTLMKPAATDYYLSRIAVRGGGGGLGRRLLGYCEQRAAEAGAGRICLEVAAGNSSAIAFYERHGFQPVDRQEVEDPATSRRLAYLHMAKRVNSAGA
jgi:ribosomal protein S18 acetylase RimI-like enzyme